MMMSRVGRQRCPRCLLLEVLGADVVLGLDVVQFVLFLVDIDPFERFVRLIVENDQVAIANVEAGQMVAGVLRIENVLVDDERCSAGIRSVSAEMKKTKINCK